MEIFGICNRFFNIAPKIQSNIQITKLLYICDNLITMAVIKSDFSLTAFNTFNISVKADHYCRVTSAKDLEELCSTPIFRQNEPLILGGGSNILFTHDYPGLVIHPLFKGLEITEESASDVCIRAGAGMIWDDLVAWAVSHDYGGIENLSGIPGNVGASPIQNIGAYGTEVAQVIERVEGYDLRSGKWRSFSNAECAFSYRNSLFKTAHKNSFLVSHVWFRLTKPPHNLVTHYGNIEATLEKKERTLASMREIILGIRHSKLPDVKELGNAGSFFKNPVVPASRIQTFKQDYPEAPVYPAEKGMMKLSAAWLIDQAGLKGFRMGNAGTHEKQALVLVNLGHAEGKEILALSEWIREKVKSKFGVELEPEVNII